MKRSNVKEELADMGRYVLTQALIAVAIKFITLLMSGRVHWRKQD